MADLDAAIREWLRPVPNINQWGGWMRRMHGAVTAVLDVHKTTEEVFETVCAHCNGWSGATARYPCPTVRAIAEKLGVEVEHD